MTINNIWAKSKVLARAFAECKRAAQKVYSQAEKIIRCPPHTPKEFRVEATKAPAAFLGLKKNIFSVLFQSIYHLLDIGEERRMLYAKLNYLFRIWVTAADNLIDREDKTTFPMRIPGNAPTMRQVISIMAADRLLKGILDEAAENNIIDAKGSSLLCDKSLQILLPSAGEESSEEGGIRLRPKP
ncbi:MAG: hypothetical protein ACE5GG_02335, partial [Candidatus Omnitrophota bacterium]